MTKTLHATETTEITLTLPPHQAHLKLTTEGFVERVYLSESGYTTLAPVLRSTEDIERLEALLIEVRSRTTGKWATK